MNYCADCKEILVGPLEWRYGKCSYCLMVDMEKSDREFWDRWFDEGGK